MRSQTLETILTRYSREQAIKRARTFFLKRWANDISEAISGYYERALYLYYDIEAGLKNLIDFAPVVYQDRDFDWAYLIQLMEFKLEKMRKFHKTEAHYVGTERNVKRLAVMVELCKRIRLKDYSEEEFNKRGFGDKDHIDRTYARETYMEKQDMELFCTYFKKYLKHFWD